ncbi:MAG: hypothetical protein IJF37_09315 [Lachnospiraceae bacterium]|nr:hypothetical protein [Lachnospiraceae bacterium]
MDEDKKERIEKDMSMDSEVRLAYGNMLWILYRQLSKDIITIEELKELDKKLKYKII